MGPITVHSDDPVLHHIAPVGLAAALAGSGSAALVVDLDPAAAPYPGRTLADLARDGVRRADLVPGRRGVARLGLGPLDPEEAGPLVARLAESWPAVVARVPGPLSGLPFVPVRALLPSPLLEPAPGPAVYQATAPGSRAPGPGILLPPLGRARIRSLLAGTVDPRWRWVRAWEAAGRLPWR